MSTFTQLPGNEDRAITIGVSQGIEEPYSNSNFDEITSTLLSYKAMIWDTQGTVFSNPNSDAITSTLLSGKSMEWAIPGEVYFNISLDTGISVSTEDKLTTNLFPHKIQQHFQLLLSKAEIITIYDVMFEARVEDMDTISTMGVAKVKEHKIQGLHQQISQGFISQASTHFHLKQNSPFNYPEDGTSVVMAAAMLTGNV